MKVVGEVRCLFKLLSFFFVSLQTESYQMLKQKKEKNLAALLGFLKRLQQEFGSSHNCAAVRGTIVVYGSQGAHMRKMGNLACRKPLNSELVRHRTSSTITYRLMRSVASIEFSIHSPSFSCDSIRVSTLQDSLAF